MSKQQLKRYGLLLDILSNFADVERQVVRQGAAPSRFIPDELLELWYVTFQNGRGMLNGILDEEIVAVLLDFGFYLDQVVDSMPHNAINKEDYIRYDEVWQEIREMADWTLTRLAFLQMPGEVDFSEN